MIWIQDPFAGLDLYSERKGKPMNELPMEFIKDLTLMTIQKEARWMEYDNEMEDFQLQRYLDEEIIPDLYLFLCGYIPDLDMELSIQIFEKDRKGIFSSAIRDQGGLHQMEFSMGRFQEDFEFNMLVYAANTQIMLREMELSYHQMSQQLAESKSGCAGCKGCG